MTDYPNGTYATIKVTNGASREWPVVERVGGGWQSGAHHYPDAMVEAVRPLALHPAEPVGVTGLAFRERVAEVLGSELPSGYKFEAYILADALLAAGVFREPPARGQIQQAVTDKLIASADDIAEAIAPAVLALMGGASGNQSNRRTSA